MGTSGSWLPSDFPNLTPADFSVTSPYDVSYNCIAWAARDTTRWWWPSDLSLSPDYWPDGVAREETVEAFVAAYGTMGYERCRDGRLEAGFERIALYVDSSNTP